MYVFLYNYVVNNNLLHIVVVKLLVYRDNYQNLPILGNIQPHSFVNFNMLCKV
jgi:hypothetical protein